MLFELTHHFLHSDRSIEQVSFHIRNILTGKQAKLVSILFQLLTDAKNANTCHVKIYPPKTV